MNISVYASVGSNWVAGLGDPTPMGWFTVFAYFSTGVLCLSCAAKPLFSSKFEDQKADLRFWLVIAGLMFLFGINKQLDLQTLLTVSLKSIADATGLYGLRRILQAVFIVAVVAGGGWLAWKFVTKFRRSARRNRLAVIGIVLIVVFVAIRATSFHYMDSLINMSFAGLKLNWIVELGGIGLIAAATLAHLRRRSRQTQWQGKLGKYDDERTNRKTRSNRFRSTQTSAASPTGTRKSRASTSRTKARRQK